MEVNTHVFTVIRYNYIRKEFAACLPGKSWSSLSTWEMEVSRSLQHSNLPAMAGRVAGIVLVTSDTARLMGLRM